MGIIENRINELRKELVKNGAIVLQNPKCGTSTITKIDDKIHYKRGNTDFTLSVELIVKTFNNFHGNKCSTVNLAKFDKEYTDNTGAPHCGCTFFMLLMNKFFGTDILGKGVRGDPYYINL